MFQTKLTAILAAVLIIGLATAVGCDGEIANSGEPDLTSGLGVIVDCDDNPSEGLEAGYISLDFRFQDAVGDTFSLSDYRGRAVILNFWSIGCDHCVGEIPYIEQVYNEWPNDELAVLTIEVFDEAEAVKAFLADSGISLPVLLDSEFEVMVQYGVDEIPRTFFIDKEGLIRGIKFGYLESMEELESIIAQVIALQEGG